MGLLQVWVRCCLQVASGACSQQCGQLEAAMRGCVVCAFVVCISDVQSLAEKQDSHTAQDWAFDVLDVQHTGRVDRYVLWRAVLCCSLGAWLAKLP